MSKTNKKLYLSFFDFLKIDENTKKVTLEINDTLILNIDQYLYFLQSIFETIMNNFIIKNKPISVTLGGKYIRDYTFAEIYILIIFLRTNIEFDIPVTEQDLVTNPNMTSNDVHTVIEILLQRHKKYFDKHQMDKEKLADIATEIIESLTKLSITYSWIAPTSISLYDIIQFAKRDHEFNQLINMKLSDDMNIKEIERMIPNLERKLIDSIIKDKKNCLYQYVATGTVKNSQLRQMFTAVGPRMDIDKTVLPYPIKGNFLNGLQDVVESYLEAVVARNALIDKDKHIKDAGYESRKIDLNNLDTFIDPNIIDCKTKYYLEYQVENEQDLKMLRYKYQILDNGTLREIDINNKKLIGKTIKIRSHSVCALPKGVCRTCYGSNSDMLLGARIGGFPSVCIQNRMSNLTISSKHYLDTNAATVDSKTISRFFKISQDKCYLKTDREYAKVKLVIDKLFYENIMENINNSEEEDDYDMTPLENAYIEESELNKKTGEIEIQKYFFDDLKNVFLYLSSEILDENKAIKSTPTSETVEIHLGKIKLTTPIMDIRMISEGIVYQVGRFIDIIDSKMTETYNDPSLFLKDITDILKDVKIVSSIQYIETLMYNSIKDASDVSRRPNFRKPDAQIRFMSIKESIMVKDVYTSLSFEKYNNQLKNMNFFNRNIDSGAFQSFFKTTKKFM